MAAAAQVPGREMSEEEFLHICHRYRTASELVSGKAVLDVGCGAGLGIPSMAARASCLLATDLSEDNVRLASKFERPGVTVRVMDAHRLEVADSSFDVVLAMEVVQYLRIEKFLVEARRVLTPGGTLFVCVPNCERRGFAPGKGTVAYYSAGELAALLNRAGFHATVMGAFRATPVAQVAAETRIWLLRLGVRVLDRFGRLLPVRRIKDNARKVLRFRPIRLVEALDEHHLARASAVPLEDLGELSDRSGYVFLYAFARKLELV